MLNDGDGAAMETLAADPKPLRSTRATDAPNALLYCSPDYFEAEMIELRRKAWHFVGTTDEFAKSNDWVRTRAFGIDIFVQSCKGNLHGFRNVCQHRGFPLRQEASGNGAILCPLHAWRYDETGALVGVARNEELFCLSREERAALSLDKVRVETVGTMVFAAIDDEVPPLEDYLGRYAPLLRAITSRAGARRHRWTGSARVNWKLYWEITLDDYHVAFVHPETLGVDIRPAWAFTYERSGAHSRMFARRTGDWEFPGFWEAVERGEYEYAGYKIHHVFPGTFLVIGREKILITRITPIAFDRVAVDDWVFEVTGNDYDDVWWDDFITLQRRVSDEDRVACEAHQAVMATFERKPLYGVLEQRLGWFHDSYETLVGERARAAVSRSLYR